MLADSRQRFPPRDRRRTRAAGYLVDYSAPNLAKELHIGHLRSTVIGDALVRMLTFLGHEVVRENHVGDWGRPFGILIEQLVESGAAGSAELTLSRNRRAYKVATQRFADDPEFAERARARVVALQRREPETMAVWQRLLELSEAHWQGVYSKLGVLLTVDDVVGRELPTRTLMPIVIERLGAAGLVQESDGAEVVFPPGFTNREGEPLPLIVRSSAGAFTYATSDLACVVDRVERVKAETLLYVVGAEQAQHLAMVFAVSAMAGLVAAACRSRAHPIRQGARQGRQDAAQPQRRSGRPRRGRRRGDRAWHRRRRRQEPGVARRAAPARSVTPSASGR